MLCSLCMLEADMKLSLKLSEHFCKRERYSLWFCPTRCGICGLCNSSGRELKRKAVQQSPGVHVSLCVAVNLHFDVGTLQQRKCHCMIKLWQLIVFLQLDIYITKYIKSAYLQSDFASLAVQDGKPGTFP